MSSLGVRRVTLHHKRSVGDGATHLQRAQTARVPACQRPSSASARNRHVRVRTQLPVPTIAGSAAQSAATPGSLSTS